MYIARAFMDETITKLINGVYSFHPVPPTNSVMVHGKVMPDQANSGNHLSFIYCSLVNHNKSYTR
jgi:methyl coenzyme M reductase subunit D